MKKAVFALLAVLMLGLTLGACSSGNDAEGAGWDYIEDKGVLIVGLDDTFAPMGFRDENNELVGFDIDLANEVGELLGIEIQFQPIDWNLKELELSSKRIDCIWNGMSATPTRQVEMSLTKKYLNNQIVIMSFDETFNVQSADELANIKYGTQAESAALETMQANSSYNSFQDKITKYKTY